MGNQKVIEATKERARLYLFFSRIFIEEPTQDLIEGIRCNKDILEALKGFGVELGESFLKEDVKDLTARLGAEYARLFILPHGELPYESVSLTGLLSQEPASEVKGFYEQNGFVVPEGFRGFPDHIGVELAFMGYLVEKESLSEGMDSERYRSLQKEFFRRHLGKWAFRFLEKVIQKAEEPFYKELARLTSSFLESEENYLGLEREQGCAREGFRQVEERNEDRLHTP